MTTCVRAFFLKIYGMLYKLTHIIIALPNRTHAIEYCEFLCTRIGACHGNGECVKETRGCTCDEGWLGKFCDRPAFEVVGLVG